MKIERLKRGFEEIIPADEFERRLQGEMRVKLGVDPTGTDLHLGHAVIFNKLRQFQDAGHTVVFLVGDFTARIGDPSGRDSTRPPLSAEEVEANARTYKEQVFEILDPEKTEVVYNSDWLEELGVNGIIDLASRYTVARLLERDDFSNRYEQGVPIRLHEFLYPLLQGWDSVAVEADLEIGGTDQKFNLLVGRQLQKQENQQPQVIGTLPILPGTDGTRKMSKSYNNHIPLDSSGAEMFGKLMSIPDELIIDYLRLLTDMPVDWVKELQENLESGAANPKEIKKKMAREITERYLGVEEADRGEENFVRTVEEGGVPAEEEMKKLIVAEDRQPLWIVDLLDESGAVESRGEAKRLLKQGAVQLDGKKLQGFDHDIEVDEPRILQVGKHSFFRLISG